MVEAHQLVETIRFSGLFREMKVFVTRGHGGVEVRAHLPVPERDSGTPLVINFVFTMPMEHLVRIDEGDFLNVVRKQVLYRMIMHEMDEAISVRGQRLWDPHARERPQLADTAEAT